MVVFYGEFFRNKMLVFIRSVFSLRACSPYPSPKKYSGGKNVLRSNKDCILNFSLGDCRRTLLHERFGVILHWRDLRSFCYSPCNNYYCQWKRWSQGHTAGNTPFDCWRMGGGDSGFQAYPGAPIPLSFLTQLPDSLSASFLSLLAPNVSLAALPWSECLYPSPRQIHMLKS